MQTLSWSPQLAHIVRSIKRTESKSTIQSSTISVEEKKAVTSQFSYQASEIKPLGVWDA